MTSVRISLLISLAEKYSVTIINIVSTIIIARLLTPLEIGVYSVGLAFVAIAHTLRDFGVGNYLIQEKELTEDRIRTAAGVTLLLAWSLAAMLALGSGLIADIYNKPEMRSVLLILSLSFVIIPFSSPTLALLRRNMAFKALYQIRIISAIVHATVAVVLAWQGYSFASLAWASLAGVSTTAVIAAFHRPNKSIIWPNFVEWRHVASFGGKSSLDALVTQIGMNSIDLIAGRMLGFTAVGIFSRAQGLISMFSREFTNAVLQVALPAFASGHRAGVNLKEPYLKAIGTLTLFAWPFYAFLALMAFPIIRIMFGDQWDAAVPLVQILAVGGMASAIWSLCGQILLGMGRINELLKAQILLQSVRVVIVFAAANYSIIHVAVGQVIFYILTYFVFYHALKPLVRIGNRDVLRATWKSLMVTVTSSIVPAFALFYLNPGPGNLWTPLLIASCGMGTGWLAGIYLFKHEFGGEIINAYHAAMGKFGRAKT
ncbi:lipopolysaccharide biosynthesis protein [Pelagibius sp. Alg239-R121]|uniref:lipopolysaccharide biosynthesis protein n=1 Tax=Pelagibius sp. Alg239-R121 TaxID=2993448 RepID=UPI0024A67216|nr:lipopolysaccharide biosynthesis protein [Pelagibius sp. Alg239-R121]